MTANTKQQGIIQVELKPIILPDTNLDLVEQLALAFQNRDAIGLEQILNETINEHGKWSSRADFINKFIGYCNKLDKIYKGIYVQTVPGNCGMEWCEFGKRGLGVSVNSTTGNKRLWSFNVVPVETKSGQLDLNSCRKFIVNSEEIPF